MRTAIIALAAVAVLAAPAAAETLRWDVSGFTAVEAVRGVSVEVEQGEAFSVRAEGSDAREIAVRVSGGKLHVSRRGWGLFGDGHGLDATVRVTMPRITALEVAQGAAITARNLRAGSIRVAASQGGQLRAEGACAELGANASMGGVIAADALQCETARASASMGGLVGLYASQAVDARASMGGQVTVHGSPARTDLTTTMGGGVAID